MNCHRCGNNYDNGGRCEYCFEKDVESSTPAAWLPPGIEVDLVTLTPIPGRAYPRPMSLDEAISLGFVYCIPRGDGVSVHSLSSRVKLHLKRAKTS